MPTLTSRSFQRQSSSAGISNGASCDSKRTALGMRLNLPDTQENEDVHNLQTDPPSSRSMPINSNLTAGQFVQTTFDGTRAQRARLLT